MSAEPRWVDARLVHHIHDASLANFGGASGIRDENLLESALARPRNLWGYNFEADVFELAASLGYGLIRNHPFIDGNKRTGLLVMNAFLRLNGQYLNPDQMDEVLMIRAVAAGERDEAELGVWLKSNCTQNKIPAP
ncbi:MAG: type II toxin-antitoxin system death-on-curing family toxin [Rhodospirillales bacterium]|nr:type II toxin-antitoxin system death-on-curing family toxin [Rhodospirillales bacterium]